MAWDVTSLLLPRIRQYAYLPDSHPSYTDTVLLQMADDALVEEILPPLHALNSEFGVTSLDRAVVSGTRDYLMPSRALFGVLRDAHLLDSAGYDLGPLDVYDVEQADAFTNISGEPDGYLVMGDVVRLAPTPTQSYTLRLYYLRRPGRLVKASTAADEAPHAITAGASGTTLTLGAAHAFDNGDLVDLVQAEPPFSVLAQGIAVSGVTGTTVNIPAAVSGLATGDYVCTTGESPVPQIPAEAHPLLARAVAVQALEESGGEERYLEALERLKSTKDEIFNLMAPRTQGTPRRIVNRAGLGPRWPGMPYRG